MFPPSLRLWRAGAARTKLSLAIFKITANLHIKFLKILSAKLSLARQFYRQSRILSAILSAKLKIPRQLAGDF